MRPVYSMTACVVIFIVLFQFRISHSGIIPGNPPLKITVWDAFGYYMYLPAVFIYKDCKELTWLPAIDKKYAVTGGSSWQAQKSDNGNYVFEYLGGVAILEVPFFFIGHCIAHIAGYPADGFSPPYQYSLGFGVLLYCAFAILLMRKILLTWFNDITTAITLIMVCLATNFIQYAAVDNEQSHAWIFPLYVIILYATEKWHQRPSFIWASIIGYVIGLATMSRPTEAIMLFIPLLWSTHTKEAAKAKWLMVKHNRRHLFFVAVFGFIGVLPQLIYWKIVTGSFIYDVGSKWEFLNPHFRVLFGWEKGWFIYTPVTLLFIAGMFFIKQFPFRKSVTLFCLLNIYIIIAWHDWRYGGSYSTRALVQSYHVFALPFATLTEKLAKSKWRLIFYILCLYLLFVNIFQTTQYCSTVLHFNDMNRKYYGRIYLNPNPSPLDMSMLDNDEMISNEYRYQKTTLVHSDTEVHISFAANTTALTQQIDIPVSKGKEAWLKVESDIYAPGNLWQTYLNADILEGDSVKHTRVRLFNAISKDDKTNKYSFYIHIPQKDAHALLKLYLSSSFPFNGVVKQIIVTKLESRFQQP